MILLMLSIFTQIRVKVSRSIPSQIYGPSQICNAQMILLPHSGLCQVGDFIQGVTPGIKKSGP
jgi:hypothetical protein